MGQKILVADDAKFMRRLLRHVLSENGYGEIEDAENGEEAVRLFQSWRPDLVVLDITMPGKSGMEVLTELLALDPAAKVLICSAMGQDTVAAQAKKAGARGFLRKPFTPEELLDAVRAILPESGQK